MTAEGKRSDRRLPLTIRAMAKPDAVCPADVRALAFEARVDDVAPGTFTVEVYRVLQAGARRGGAGRGAVRAQS